MFFYFHVTNLSHLNWGEDYWEFGNVDVSVYFWPKHFAYWQNFLKVLNSYRLHTISSAIAMGCWRSRQENFLFSTAFLFNEESKNVENTCNLAKLRKNWKQFNFFQAPKIDLWSKTRTTTEMIGIGILIKELEQFKVWIGIKWLIEIK